MRGVVSVNHESIALEAGGGWQTGRRGCDGRADCVTQSDPMYKRDEITHAAAAAAECSDSQRCRPYWYNISNQ